MVVGYVPLPSSFHHNILLVGSVPALWSVLVSIEMVRFTSWTMES